MRVSKISALEIYARVRGLYHFSESRTRMVLRIQLFSINSNVVLSYRFSPCLFPCFIFCCCVFFVSIFFHFNLYCICFRSSFSSLVWCVNSHYLSPFLPSFIVIPAPSPLSSLLSFYPFSYHSLSPSLSLSPRPLVFFLLPLLVLPVFSSLSLPGLFHLS